MNPRPYGDNFVLAVRKFLHDNQFKSLGQINAEILADLAQRFQDHYAGQQKAKKKSGDATPEEIAIYEAYPRKEGRGAALLAIRQALGKTTPERLKEAVAKYGLCVARWPKSYRYTEGRDLCPMPTTWFNQERYEDDPKHWLPAGMFTRLDDVPNTETPPNPASLVEPQGWREKVKADESLQIFAGRDWDTINPHYKKLIVKLCSP